MIRCGLCGRDFPEDAGVQACASCPLSKVKGKNGCGMVKCPYCGYENPKEAGIIKKLRSLGRSKR